MKHFKELGELDDSEYIKLAVVGKPNAGKSSLCNKLLGFDRTIVSDIAGTTRDAIDTPFIYNDKKYMIIDTAGIDDVGQLGLQRVEKTFSVIDRIDVALIVCDYNGISEFESNLIIEFQKELLIDRDKNTDDMEKLYHPVRILCDAVKKIIALMDEKNRESNSYSFFDVLHKSFDIITKLDSQSIESMENLQELLKTYTLIRLK